MVYRGSGDVEHGPRDIVSQCDIVSHCPAPLGPQSVIYCAILGYGMGLCGMLYAPRGACSGGRSCLEGPPSFYINSCYFSERVAFMVSCNVGGVCLQGSRGLKVTTLQVPYVSTIVCGPVGHVGRDIQT